MFEVGGGPPFTNQDPTLADIESGASPCLAGDFVERRHPETVSLTILGCEHILARTGGGGRACRRNSVESYKTPSTTPTFIFLLHNSRK